MAKGVQDQEVDLIRAVVRESKCVTFVMVNVLLGGCRALGGPHWSEIMSTAV
jgi:hypothetical protein